MLRVLTCCPFHPFQAVKNAGMKSSIRSMMPKLACLGKRMATLTCRTLLLGFGRGACVACQPPRLAHGCSAQHVPRQSTCSCTAHHTTFGCTLPVVRHPTFSCTPSRGVDSAPPNLWLGVHHPTFSCAPWADRPSTRTDGPSTRMDGPSTRMDRPAQMGPAPVQMGPAPAWTGPAPAWTGPAPVQTGPARAWMGPARAHQCGLATAITERPQRGAKPSV